MIKIEQVFCEENVLSEVTQAQTVFYRCPAKRNAVIFSSERSHYFVRANLRNGSWYDFIHVAHVAGARPVDQF